MKRLDEQVHPVCLEPLTPIHIGSGETMDPMSYIIKKENDGHYLYQIDLPAWIEDQPNPASLADFFQKQNLAEIRSYLAHNVDTSIYSFSRIRVMDDTIVDTYEDNLGRKDSANQLLIDEAIKNPLSGAVIIPGSSIKGAIRTAIIDYLDQELNLELNKAGKNYNNILEDIFGKSNIPNTFQDLKLGDFETKINEATVFSAREVRRKQSDRSATPKNNCVVTPSLCSEGEKYSFYSTMTVGRIFGEKHPSVISVNYKGKKYQWELNELMQLCNKFYGKRYFEEKKKFYKQSHLQTTDGLLELVEKQLQDVSSNEMLLRLGHYSHIECMSITNNKPKGRKIQGTDKTVYGTTRTLANGLYPFGWVKLRICDWEEFEKAREAKHKHDEKILTKRRESREEIREKVEEQLRLEEERERKRQEEQEKQAQKEAELAAMSEEERLVYFVEQGEANENEVNELYFKLDQFEESEKERVAGLIKKRWQMEKKKWSGKLSPKQKDKVAKIKSILGEQ